MPYLLSLLIVLAAAGCGSDPSVNADPVGATSEREEVAEIENAASDEPLKIGGEVRPPVVIEKSAPELPEEYLTGEYQFHILILHAVVDREGKVISVRAGNYQDHELTPIYIDNLKKWRFKPATLRGEPVAVEFSFSVGHFPVSRVR